MDIGVPTNESLADYGSSTYWDEKYAELMASLHKVSKKKIASEFKKEEEDITTKDDNNDSSKEEEDIKTFDWYQGYEELEPHLLNILESLPNGKNSQILIPGCGNSNIPIELKKAGYENIDAIDTCSSVIRYMQNKAPQIEYAIMDAKEMKYFNNETFDLVIDKALFDSLLCTEENIINISYYLKEVYRVLAKGGVYMCISHGFPLSRLGYFKAKKLLWDVETIPIQKIDVEGYEEQGANSKYHYIYVCSKN